MKSVLLTLFLAVVTTIGIHAQEKYEYATVRTDAAAIISTTSESQKVIPIKLKEIEKDLLRKVNDLIEKGWEVYSTTSMQGSFEATYFLREKKN